MGPRPHSRVLASLVAEHGWKCGAEVGVFRGQTLFHLLDTFPSLTMIGVDKWENIDKKSYGRFDLPPIGERVRVQAKTYGARCTVFHMDSVKAAGCVADDSLDFVFIDAFHSYEAARADILAWLPKVKAEGYITGHDWHHKSVARALDELLPGWAKHDHHVWSRAKMDAGPE
ncbi:MAG TPA: class I SAM-dependent methyltransferase [Alphaproteobacteria bacterium]|nr:class I SAM-dependent methyltransferase [Alphaproteobacteria bacterium]